MKPYMPFEKLAKGTAKLAGNVAKAGVNGTAKAVKGTLGKR